MRYHYEEPVIYVSIRAAVYIYNHPGFKDFFNQRSGPAVDGLYQIVTIRQIMWALNMKPLKREQYGTYFDGRDI